MIGLRKKRTKAKKIAKRTSTPKKIVFNEEVINKMIREKAYFIWEKKGSPQGQDVQIWLEAEHCIKSGL